MDTFTGTPNMVSEKAKNKPQGWHKNTLIVKPFVTRCTGVRLYDGGMRGLEKGMGFTNKIHSKWFDNRWISDRYYNRNK